MAEESAAWQVPSADLTLPEDEIHIWRAFLDQAPFSIERLKSLLADDERQRAASFHFVRDRNRFIVARGLLRTILGLYLRSEPRGLRFLYSARGKPSLAPAGKGSKGSAGEVRFNLAHSHEVALFAFSSACEPGIDVEFVRPLADARQIAERFFSVRENGVLRELDPVEMHRRFFLYWTRKEAYLKALGEGLAGLAGDIRQIDTAAPPGQPLIVPPSQDNGQRSWLVHDIEPAPGYVAALAFPQQDMQIVYYQLAF
ncbi:MAG: 4'-phosphopantetheinyl transferase superfamily protein [Ktedonobacteraceae bacterium]|nr:4'-phosphopantetheinyl transferase superfamily protein [Ktedonobacteraceae bacterium]